MNTHFFSKHVARLLGLAGLLPFMLMTLSVWFCPLDWQAAIIRAQVGYGIALLAFLGGIHWGGALATPGLPIKDAKKALALGVLPSFMAFTALMGEVGMAFIMLTIAFIVSYQIDKRLYQWYKMPEWMMRLRFKLTIVVMATLLLTFLAVNVRKFL